MAELNYSSVQGFVDWVSADFAGILANDQVNSYDPDTLKAKGAIETALLFAEGEVDGYLNKRGYKTPIDSKYERTIDVLRIYVFNLAAYELHGRRGITKDRYYKYTRAMSNLKQIGNGSKHLPEKIPMASGGTVRSGNTHKSTFNQTSKRDKLSI